MDDRHMDRPAGDTGEIAVGTHGAGRLGSLIGSVAQDVLHKAECPVLAIPERAVAAASSDESVRAST